MYTILPSVSIGTDAQIPNCIPYYIQGKVKRGCLISFFNLLRIAYSEMFSNSSTNKKGLSKTC